MLSFEQFKAHFYSQNWVRLFIKRYNEQHVDIELNTSLKRIYDDGDCRNTVDRLLTWANTAEGRSYWSGVNEKFYHYVCDCNQE